MLCTSCEKLIQCELAKHNIKTRSIKIGKADILYDEEKISLNSVNNILKNIGYELAIKPEEILIAKIKKTVVDLVFHMSNINSIVRKSEYLVEMLNMNYEKIAREFRKHEPITLEKYIILVKIERIKEMLEHEEYTLSEIAYVMDYSSVQYLSSQFKKITGVTVSEYKDHKTAGRIPLDKLIELSA